MVLERLVCRDVYVAVYIECCMLSFAAYLGHDYWALLHSSTMLKVLFRLHYLSESLVYNNTHCLAGIHGLSSACRATYLAYVITNGLLCCASNWSML